MPDQIPPTLSEWIDARELDRSVLNSTDYVDNRAIFAELGRAFYTRNVRPDPIVEACAWCGIKLISGAVPVGYVDNHDGTKSLLCDACYGKKDGVAHAKDIAITPKEKRSEKGVLMIARTSAGSPQEYWFQTLFIGDVDKAREIVTKEHDKLGHSPTPGDWCRSCVPQSEAASILDYNLDTPAEIRRLLAKGGIDRIFLLYALTLKRTRSKKHPGKKVWLGASRDGR